MTCYEKSYFKKGVLYIAGVDEVGRGPLAGPVVAAAVILPKDIFIEGLNDSKQVSENKRDLLFDTILKSALSVGIGSVNNKFIDKLNIKNATQMAMELAVKKLQTKPQVILIDAETINTNGIEQNSIIKGDEQSISIAAASIIAKVTRDRLMTTLDSKYPEYNFKKHKGYGTKEHIEAIKKYGLSPIHRKTFTKNFI